MEENTSPIQKESSEPTQQTPPQALEQEPKKGHSKSIKISLAILVLSSCLIAIYLTNAENKKQVVVPQKPIQVEKPIEDPYPVDDNDVNWKEYTNQKYEFYIKYPVKGVLTQYDISPEEPSVFKVYFTPDTSKIKNIDAVEETDINEGMLFKITVVKDIELKTPETAAQEKISFFKTVCPATAKISGLQKGEFSGFESQTFTVRDCRGNYKVTFVKRKTNMYEMSQFSTGDVGFEQRYKATTDKMLSNMRLTNTISPVPLEKWIEFTNQGVAFKHPQMDDKCCSISGPVQIDGYRGANTIVVLAMPGGISNAGASFNGFGVFSVDRINTEEEMTAYIDKQKSALIEEYKIVVGKTPDVQESSTSVSGLPAIYLKNIAWWGDMVFVPFKDANGKSTVFMFAKTEVLKGEFENLFTEILSTVSIGKN